MGPDEDSGPNFNPPGSNRYMRKRLIQSFVMVHVIKGMGGR